MTALFVLCGGLSALLESVSPERAPAPKWTRARLSDWLWWPFSAFVTGNLTRALAVGLVVEVAMATGLASTPIGALPALATVPWGIGRSPVLAQYFFALFAGDLVNYWNHRLRHTRWFWPFHAVHHSPTRLDWLSAARIHPVDDLVDNVGVGLLLAACGVPVPVWMATGPFLLFFDMFLHANLAIPRVPGRPLARLLATPALHRRHHAEDRPSANFAGVFPVWDLIFGTFDLPEVATAQFGAGEPLPDGLPGQLAFPFRRFIADAQEAPLRGV